MTKKNIFHEDIKKKSSNRSYRTTSNLCLFLKATNECFFMYILFDVASWFGKHIYWLRLRLTQHYNGNDETK